MIFRHLLVPFVFLTTPAVFPEMAYAQPADSIVSAEAPAKPAAMEKPAAAATAKPPSEEAVALQRYMPLIGMGFTIVLLLVIFGFVAVTDKNRHETIRRYIELNKEVPPQLLSDSPNKWNKDNRVTSSDRRKGIICVATGLGLGFALLLLTGSWRGFAVGAIPLFIGFGYLLLAIAGTNSTDER